MLASQVEYLHFKMTKLVWREGTVPPSALLKYTATLSESELPEENMIVYRLYTAVYHKDLAAPFSAPLLLCKGTSV